MHTTPSPKQNSKKKKHKTEQNHSAEKKEKSKLAEYKLQATEEQEEKLPQASKTKSSLQKILAATT